MRNAYVCGMIAGAIAMAQPAVAATIDPGAPQTLVSAMQEAGYKAVLEQKKDADPLVRSASSGSNFTLFLLNCTDHVKCLTVQFYAGYNHKGVSLEKLNEWNSAHRFARAYRDGSGDPVIEMDLDMDKGGISKDLFEANLETWVSLMGQFEEHIGFR